MRKSIEQNIVLNNNQSVAQCIFSAFDADLQSEIPDISLNLLELIDKFFMLFQFHKYLRSHFLILSRALFYIFV